MATCGSRKVDDDSAVGVDVLPKVAKEVYDDSAVGGEVLPKGAQEVEEDSAVGEELLPIAWAALKADTNSPCDPCETHFWFLWPRRWKNASSRNYGDRRRQAALI